MSQIPVRLLGQSGCRLQFGPTVVYLDPYLSNSVQELDAADLERRVPIPFAPDAVSDADWVLITHEHIDHCDPHTLPKLAKASPQARFVGPPGVRARLAAWGIAAERIQATSSNWEMLSESLALRTVPAAHPEIAPHGSEFNCVGYVLRHAGEMIYLAGDTFARQEIIDAVKADGPVHTAFLPVNEHNFFRARRGIVGNMSVREAFQFAVEIGARQVVAVHWDMFAINSVAPEEIRLIHKLLRPGFDLLIGPQTLHLGKTAVSVVIRTLNEARHLEALIEGIHAQQTEGLDVEIVIVDSGSTDGTLAIAERHGCRILHITREEFSFGRSLNIGCAAARGDILAITSGHCVPRDKRWLQQLCQPLLDGTAEYSYGRQLGGDDSHFSEKRIFAKYFPAEPKIPQQGFFCNNANSALTKGAWARFRFDETLTGLEDMELAQRLVANGGKVAYVAEAGVFHHHNENWAQVRRRFEREAIALQRIMPQVHVDLADTLRYIATSVWKDWRAAREAGRKDVLGQIVCYRWNQYLGSWAGNHEHRKLSRAEKEKYFFPN